MQANPGMYLALLHYPMYNKNREIITTSVTNLDLHDISRVVRTYDLAGFYVVHPASGQRELIARITEFWQEGCGGGYNPDRCEAFHRLRIESSLEQTLQSINAREGARPLIVATDARRYENSVSFKELRQRLETGEQPVLLLFGTGWGISAEVMRSCDLILEPVAPQSDYNHLSVRSAAAIIVDRLRGENWF